MRRCLNSRGRHLCARAVPAHHADGICGYLKKPIVPEMLFKTVENCARMGVSAKT